MDLMFAIDSNNFDEFIRRLSRNGQDSIYEGSRDTRSQPYFLKKAKYIGNGYVEVRVSVNVDGIYGSASREVAKFEKKLRGLAERFSFTKIMDIDKECPPTTIYSLSHSFNSPTVLSGEYPNSFMHEGKPVSVPRKRTKEVVLNENHWVGRDLSDRL